MKSAFSRVRMVLVGTTHPGNIGSSARAMKTMGFSQMKLVQPRVFPHEQAVAMAAGADDILDAAQCCQTLPQALEGAKLILGTSARPRDLDLPGLTPKEAAYLVSQQAEDIEVAIIFGREHAGLTNDELMHCHYHIQIPSNPEFSSLNLAQAVQVQCYELRQHMMVETPKPKHQHQAAAHQDIERLYIHLEQVLTEIDFLKKSASPGRLMQRVKRLFNRTGLEQTEVNFLRGMLSQIQQRIDSQHTKE